MDNLEEKIRLTTFWYARTKGQHRQRLNGGERPGYSRLSSMFVSFPIYFGLFLCLSAPKMCVYGRFESFAFAFIFSIVRLILRVSFFLNSKSSSLFTTDLFLLICKNEFRQSKPNGCLHRKRVEGTYGS